MSELKSKSSLSQSKRRLIELMQELNFGRIECLRILAGQPVFDPAPRVIRKVKFGGENGPRPEIISRDFWLKQQAIELFETIASVGDGEVLTIDVKHGLPFSLEIEYLPDNAEGDRHA